MRGIHASPVLAHVVKMQPFRQAVVRQPPRNDVRADGLCVGNLGISDLSVSFGAEAAEPLPALAWCVAIYAAPKLLRSVAMHPASLLDCCHNAMLSNRSDGIGSPRARDVSLHRVGWVGFVFNPVFKAFQPPFSLHSAL